MSDVAEQVAEVVAENVEEAIDGVVEVVEVVRSNVPLMIGVGVAGAGLGAVGGYFFAAYRLGKKFDQRLEDELEATKNFYATVGKVGPDGESLSPMDVLEERDPEAAAALKSYSGEEDDAQDEAQIAKLVEKARIQSVSVDKEVGPAGGKIETVEKVEVEVETTRNAFDDALYDHEEELKHRSKHEPYIITKDEFYENEHDYENHELTYFEGDGELIGENDKPFEDLDNIIGDDKLARFGAGSGDPNTVFVRNDKLGIDYHIVRSNQSYLESLGLGPEPKELKHSADRRREFRRGDV